VPTVSTRAQLFIGGPWVSPHATETIEVVCPGTEESIAEVPSADPADIDRAVAAARDAFDNGPWPQFTALERAESIARLSAAVSERTGTFAGIISSEIGSPRAWSLHGQVTIATAVLDSYTRFGPDYPWETTRAGMGRHDVRVRQLPVGVVAAIVPWNAPLFIAALKLGPALAAGCSVVLKPAQETALDSFVLAEAVLEAGLPPGVVNIVPAGPEGSERLVRQAGVDKVSFTGSTAVGRRIGELCGADVRRCTLELGGKSAAILLDDVDLSERTVRQLVTAAMANNGQVCAAQTRILSPRSRYREVVDALAGAVGALRVGDPFDEATDVGPVATSRQRGRVEGYIQTGRLEGARAVVGGGRPAHMDRGWYVEPTVFADAHNEMTIAKEEIFGPVAVVIPYDGDDEAVSLANQSDYGLTGTVWTSDIERGTDLAGRVRAGVLAINSPAPMDLGAPFGGFKLSGIGRECGPEAIQDYAEYQSILVPRH
jgi:aldehyde dehydrogenase (NAD+)